MVVIVSGVGGSSANEFHISQDLSLGAVGMVNAGA
jgi:hypothetical protein